MYDMARKLSFEQMIPFAFLINFCMRIMICKKRASPVKPPRMVVHGGGGVGKSFMINCISKWIEKIMREPGDNPFKPKVIVMMFMFLFYI